jgi:signal transduction histidine kinase
VAESQQTTRRHVIELEAPDSLLLEVDGARLQRALSNLLGNAIKYSPDGGSVRVTIREHAGAAEIMITDQGVGIPAADLERVFGRFERGSNVTGRFAGTGIGLASAQRIVEQHGGTISASSVLGAGTTITIILPACRKQP